MLFIVNPISGKGSKSEIVSKLESAGYRVVCTQYPGEAEVLAREAKEKRIIAVGGDGTVNEVARGIVGTDKILGIIPRGSGDGLALHLGISHDFNKALDTAIGENIRLMDAAKVNGRFFFSVCGVGIDALVSKRFADSGKRGLVNYLEQAVKTWIDYVPEKYTINIDGKEWESEALLITVGNSDQWGNGAKVTPLADSCDGILDITVAQKFPSFEIPELAYRLMAGNVNKNHHVHCYRGKHIVITRQSEGPAHVDGEWFNTGTRLEIDIIPSALKVLVP